MKKIKIDKIYCYNDNDNANDELFNFKKNENIIIIQKRDNAPLYDIGIIIHLNGKTILKVYQIGINKEESALNKIDKDIIIFDLIYFITKLKNKYNIKIDELYFGIITTKDGYDKNFGEKKKDEKIYFENIIFNGENLEKSYKNYKIMKNFCEGNLFEFLVFDKKNKTFNIHNKNNILEPINFSKYINKSFLINIDQYKYSNILNIIKMYVNKNDYSIEYINNIIGNYNELKVLGKFQTSDNIFPEIKGNNLYIFWEDMKIGKFCNYDGTNIFCNERENFSYKGKYFIVCLIKDVEEIKKEKIVSTVYYD